MKNVTAKSVDKILKQIEENKSIKHMGNFVKLFRFIVNEDDENADNNKLFVIQDTQVYNKIMIFALRIFPNILNEIAHDVIIYRKNIYKF